MLALPNLNNVFHVNDEASLVAIGVVLNLR
jgi:hypothetical protein